MLIREEEPQNPVARKAGQLNLSMKISSILRRVGMDTEDSRVGDTFISNLFFNANI